MRIKILGALLLLTCFQRIAPAAITFENFNTNEGRFNLAPNFSGSTTNLLASSTADRVVSPNPILEGAGSERLVLNMTTAGASTRLRLLSGGGSAAGASGSPANTVFNLSAGIDGFIGFYLLSPISNIAAWTATIALDGPTGAVGEMSQGIPINIINDGLWHLYEWNLDNAASWQAVAGIGGDAVLNNGAASIDSIILRSTAGQNSTFFMDFIAKSDSDSVGNLVAVPEPSTLITVGLACAGALAYRRRKTTQSVATF